jgi:hypothetical protein
MSESRQDRSERRIDFDPKHPVLAGRLLATAGGFDGWACIKIFFRDERGAGSPPVKWGKH